MRKLEIFIPILGSILLLAGYSYPLLVGKVTDVGTYLASLAAIVISWITLYYSLLRPLLRKPVFKLEPNAGTVTFDPKDGQKTYLRLRVTNIGTTAAKNCVGKILEIRDEDKNIIPYDPLHFFWARQNDEDVGFHPVNIYSGDAEFLDIARIGHKNQNFKFRVSTLGQPLPSGKYLPMKSYYFKLALYADDMEPFQTWYQVKLNKGSLKDTVLEKVKEPKTP
jgi:hypothetical protein